MRLLSTKSFLIGLVFLGLSTSTQAAYTTFYSDTTTFSGYGYAPGTGTATVGSSLTSLMTADDITPTAGFAGSAVNSISFSVANLNATTVTATAELLLYNSNTAGTAPTTLIGGLIFNPITFGVGVNLLTYTSATSIFTLPSGTFWAGLVFTNNAGTTGATAAQLNELGQGIFGPPTVGSSQDYFFQSSSASSNLTNNPAGGLLYFGGNPAANFGFSFSGTPLVSVPEPSSLALMGLAGISIAFGTGLTRRRRAVREA